MADAQAVEAAPGGKSKMPILLGAGLALILGAAGFYVMYSGMLDGGGNTSSGHDTASHAVSDVAFVAIEPILVSLSGDTRTRHLRFRAHLEVAPGDEESVEALMPRILDVLNGYLRAVEPSMLERRTSLIRIRSQMLRRIQLVVGEGRVHDLLVTEFVLD